MGTQNFGTTNIVRLYESWDSLAKERPELCIKLKDGKITDVLFPNEAENTTLVILSGKVAHLEYTLNGEYVKYTSPDAHKSKIYELIEEYNKKLLTK